MIRAQQRSIALKEVRMKAYDHQSGNAHNGAAMLADYGSEVHAHPPVHGYLQYMLP
jgi:hypothetical protein